MIWRKLFTNQSVRLIRKQMNRYEPKLLMYTLYQLKFKKQI